MWEETRSQLPGLQMVDPDGFDMLRFSSCWWPYTPQEQDRTQSPHCARSCSSAAAAFKATNKQSNPYNLIFHNPDGSVLNSKQDTTDFRRLLEMAQIPHPETHSVQVTRQSAVTLLASTGVDAQLIKKII